MERDLNDVIRKVEKTTSDYIQECHFHSIQNGTICDRLRRLLIESRELKNYETTEQFTLTTTEIEKLINEYLSSCKTHILKTYEVSESLSQLLIDLKRNRGDKT